MISKRKDMEFMRNLQKDLHILTYIHYLLCANLSMQL